MTRSPQFLVAALVAIATTLAGCRGHQLKPDTAVVQVSQEPDSLIPMRSAMNVTGTVAALFYSGLVTLDDHGRWAPDLAERVPTIANGDVTLGRRGMRVRYRLRRGVTWHDGKPFTSADVAATWKLLTNPKFPAISTAGYEHITAVETPDAATAIVVYKTPYAPYLELLPYILPAHLMTAGDPAHGPSDRVPVGTGPYVFESWVSGDRLSVTANARYFRGAPGIPRVEVRFVNNEDAAFQMWRAGEVDLLQGAPPTEYDYLQAQAPGRVFVTPSSTWEHLLFNLDRPAVKDVRVRQAIARLIDRQVLNARAYGGVFQPAWSDIPTFSWAFEPTLDRRWPFDPAGAAKLLDDAGYRLGEDGVRRKGGTPLALTLVTTSDKPSRARAAQIWRKRWQDQGIRLTIETQPASTMFGSAASHGTLATGAFDMALVAGVSRPDPDASFRWRSDQVPPEGQNRARYRSPEVDRLLDEGQRTIDPAARKAIYKRLSEKLCQDVPMVPLLTWANVDATSERLKGFRPNPTLRGNLWNVWEWRLSDPNAPSP